MAGREVHLLVLVHGWMGKPSDLNDMKETMEASIPSKATLKLNVLVTKSNPGFQTMDGIEWGARRVASEVSEAFVEGHCD